MSDYEATARKLWTELHAYEPTDEEISTIAAALEAAVEAEREECAKVMDAMERADQNGIYAQVAQAIRSRDTR